MIKLIIADDEKWVRTAVKTLIPYERLSISLACEAANGIEALELCRRHEPDILVTDIMMPGLTGLELIKELRQRQPELKIIIISGYSDFEYARTAMKYGIRDYLLKPVDENELCQVLERIIGEIGERRKPERLASMDGEQLRLALPVMRETFLNQLISKNSMTAENIRSELRKYKIDMPFDIFTVCVTVHDENFPSETGEKAGERYKAIVKRVMKRYAGAVTFSHIQDRDRLVSIINGDNSEGIEKAFNIGSLILAKKLGASFSTGISPSGRRFGMLPELYLKACEASEARFWDGKSTLATYSPGLAADDRIMPLQEEMLNKIALNIKLSNIQTAISYVEGLCAAMKAERGMKPSSVKEFFWQFLQSVATLLNIQIPFIRRETAMTGEHPYDRIKSTLFIDSLECCVKDMLQRMYDCYHDKNPINGGSLVISAKKIIENNFSADISLDQVARHVHLSPAYLSELFKKETGMSFIDYKTIVRIEHAKKLLKAGGLNVSEISAKVGYSDPKYFSKLFKKITGKTIFEYKKESK